MGMNEEVKDTLMEIITEMDILKDKLDTLEDRLYNLIVTNYNRKVIK